jgi:hypothetical protein
VSLPWASLLGRTHVDVEAEAIAVLHTASQGTVNVSAQSDPWLAGMPAGSTASYNDVAGNPNSDDPAVRKQSPKQLTIPVVPGSYITFEDISGQVRHGPTLQNYEPDGKNSMYTHGADSPGGPTPAAENGIGDVKMPITAFMGVFLGAQRPDLTPAPDITERLDYSDPSTRDDEYYDNLKTKLPFFIGDGKTGTASGAMQKFKVPDGATRLFVR